MISQRHRTTELMDQPNLDPNLHVAALNGLRRINSISRMRRFCGPRYPKQPANSIPFQFASSIWRAAVAIMRSRFLG